MNSGKVVGKIADARTRAVNVEAVIWSVKTHDERLTHPIRELDTEVCVFIRDFKLELVDNDKALQKNSLLKQNAANDMTGFAKVTFSIDHVDSVYETLKKKDAIFAITLRDSNINPAEQFFIVLDCDNNWLQFIGKKWLWRGCSNATSAT